MSKGRSLFLFAACANLLMALLLLVSCDKQRGCNRFGSENYDPDAIVDDGSCIEMRDKFLGQYSVTADCSEGAYLSTISETSDRFIVEITNIGDTLGTVTAEVIADNITIERQTVRTSVTVEGAGVYNSELNVLDMTIRIRDRRSGTEVITNCIDRCVKN
ncbi:MAG: hypothetical protein K9J06_13560 [Flavobacteriales bacterium]|nr:hypothetical protein [Flavobacteriales bacterium]